MLNIDMYDSIQNNFAEIWTFKDLCVNLQANQEANVP